LIEQSRIPLEGTKEVLMLETTRQGGEIGGFAEQVEPGGVTSTKRFFRF
jgi:hypothetical protein